jgi:hypothetical protein
MQDKKIEIRIARNKFENADEKFWIEWILVPFIANSEVEESKKRGLASIKVGRRRYLHITLD